MFDELSKSVKANLYQRVVSPLYGAFIFSWCVSNWRIIYLTVFVDKDIVRDRAGSQISKLEYIERYLMHDDRLFWYPLTTSIILILVLPVLANGAYWINEKYLQWRRDQKIKIQQKSPIDREQFLKVLDNLEEEKSRYAKLVQEKTDAILQKTQLELENEKAQRELLKVENTLSYNKARIQDNEETIKTLSGRIDNQNEIITALRNEVGSRPPLLSDFFQGHWLNVHTYPDNTEGQELVEIKEGYKYYANEVHVFNVESLIVNRKDNALSFVKVKVSDPSVRLLNELTYDGVSTYSGYEYTGTATIRIRYTRQIIRPDLA